MALCCSKELSRSSVRRRTVLLRWWRDCRAWRITGGGPGSCAVPSRKFQWPQKRSGVDTPRGSRRGVNAVRKAGAGGRITERGMGSSGPRCHCARICSRDSRSSCPLTGAIVERSAAHP